MNTGTGTREFTGTVQDWIDVLRHADPNSFVTDSNGNQLECLLTPKDDHTGFTAAVVRKEGDPEIREIVFGEGKVVITKLKTESGDCCLRLSTLSEVQPVGRAITSIPIPEHQKEDVYIVFKNIEGLRVFQDAINYSALLIGGYFDD